MSNFSLRSAFILLISVYCISASDTDIAERSLEKIDWILVNQQDSIDVYKERNPEGNLVAVRGTTKIHAPLEVILSLLVNADFESQKEWVPDLKEFSTVSSNTVFNRLLYVHVNIPWPARDRDFVYQAKIRIQNEQKIVRLDYQSVAHGVPEKRYVVRGSMRTLFMLRRLSETTTIFDFRSIVDPAGVIPNFIVNISQRNYSYTMLKKIRQRVYEKQHAIKVLDEFKHL